VYLVCRQDQVERPALIAFREWLLREARESQEAFDAAEKEPPKKAAKG
jgi:hypothetical protein